MATTSFYLDIRSSKDGGPAPVKIAVRHKNSSAFITTGVSVLPAHWDSRRHVVTSAEPNAKRMNVILNKKMTDVEAALLRLIDEGELPGLTAAQIRTKVILIIDPDAKKAADGESLFRSRFVRFMEQKMNPGTRNIYAFTLRKIEEFDRKLPQRRFEDITKDYLRDFENFCARTEKKNTRNIHLRNIRTVFNDAIDAGITQSYPFRKFALTPEPTRKKALTAEQMRTLATYPCAPHQEQYRDMFLLMFMLRGINIGDMLQAKKSDIRNGRLEYRRNKVGTLFSVKIEPEAMDVINRYKGDKHLLDPLDRYKSHLDYLHHLNDGLKDIGKTTGKRGKKTGEGLFPELSSNWARHTWATLAAKLDIPKEVISKGLGHSFGLSVTDIYIDFDNSKIDDANRRVIDYVLYGKE